MRHRIAIYFDIDGTEDEVIEKAWKIARNAEREDDSVHNAVASDEPRLLDADEIVSFFPTSP